MADIGVAIFKIVHAKTWNERVAQIRLIPQNYGTGAHTAIYGAIERYREREDATALPPQPRRSGDEDQRARRTTQPGGGDRAQPIPVVTAPAVPCIHVCTECDDCSVRAAAGKARATPRERIVAITLRDRRRPGRIPGRTGSHRARSVSRVSGPAGQVTFAREYFSAATISADTSQSSSAYRGSRA